MAESQKLDAAKRVQWKNRLNEAGFESKEDFAQARLDKMDRDSLEAQIAVFDDQCKQAATLLAQAQKSIKGACSQICQRFQLPMS